MKKLETAIIGGSGCWRQAGSTERVDRLYPLGIGTNAPSEIRYTQRHPYRTCEPSPSRIRRYLPSGDHSRGVPVFFPGSMRLDLPVATFSRAGSQSAVMYDIQSPEGDHSGVLPFAIFRDVPVS